MHVSDSIVRWCGGLCLPLHGLQCAFYLHVVSLGRKLHTHLACVCNFLQNEGLYNIMLYEYYARLDKVEVINNIHSPGKEKVLILYTDSYDDVVSGPHVARL